MHKNKKQSEYYGKLSVDKSDAGRLLSRGQNVDEKSRMRNVSERDTIGASVLSGSI